MKNLKFDFFKVSIVLILLGFLLVFYQSSRNGRFSNAGSIGILDTRNGAVYINSGGNSKMVMKPIIK